MSEKAKPDSKSTVMGFDTGQFQYVYRYVTVPVCLSIRYSSNKIYRYVTVPVILIDTLQFQYVYRYVTVPVILIDTLQLQ
jgi:hypothetical protein